MRNVRTKRSKLISILRRE